MGLSFRKSWKFGPFRVNLSKSGISLSIGIPGLGINLSNRGVRFSGSKYGLRYQKQVKLKGN